MFENYPKVRAPLPEAYKKIYKKHYRSNRDGDTKAAGLAQKMESWLHKKVAADVSPQHDKKTLEIGAGTLNQLDYEVSPHYDIIEPYTELYYDSHHLEKINKIYTDIDEIDLAERYDRITSVATFEHITDLPKVVAKTCLLLKDCGTLRTSIPNEGTLLWKLGYTLTTGIEFKLRYGLNYSTMMNFEHVNTAPEIESVLAYFYERNQCSTFGLSKGLAFYRFYESSGPRLSKAKEYLESIGQG